MSPAVAPISPAWRRLFAALALAAVAACADGSGTTDVPVPTTVSLGAPSVTLSSIGASTTVTAVVRDASGTPVDGAAVTWSSDAPAVVRVTGSGPQATLTAVGRGAGVVTARSGALSTSVTVFVRAAFAVSVSPGVASLRIGESTSLQANVSADDGASTAVTWSSGTPAVATVSAQGLVTAISEGSAVITARSTSDPDVTARATITVRPPRTVQLSAATLDIGRAESRRLTATVQVEPGQPIGVTWRTNRPLIATVDQTGLVTGVSDGEATITAVALADTTLRASALVRVVPIVRSIAVAPAAATINVGQTRTFTATVVADQGASAATVWSSSNAAVASVNAQGVATAIGAGTAIIRARSVADSTREASATLTVIARPITLALDTRSLGLTPGRAVAASATVSADPGVTTAVRWTSRDPSVASVNAAGLITGVGAGRTHVIAEAEANSAARDSIAVTVAPQLATAWSAERLGGPLIEDVVSLHTVSASLAFAVNARGDIYRWDGEQWVSAVRGSQFGTAFRAVHGVSAAAITAVGTNGTIVHFDGSTWRAMTSGTTIDLHAVWMFAADSAWAAGDDGVVLRRSGADWTGVSGSGSTHWRGVWGTGLRAFVVGDGGAIRRWQPSGWTALASGTDEMLHAVWGDNALGEPTVYVAGDIGILLRSVGTTFVREPTGTTADLFAITGTNTGTMVAAGEGVLLTRGVSGWRPEPLPYAARFTAAAIDGTGAVWIGGQRGLVMRGRPSQAWSTLSVTPDLLDVWSSSPTHAIAVGELGFIYRWNGTVWTRQAAPTLERLNTVWAASSSAAFAGGDHGVLLRWTGSAWVETSSPSSSHIYAMWGADATNVWAVTESGEILRWDGLDWQIAHVHGDPLFAVHGTSAQDVHAVGVDGTVLHWNGATWSSRSTGTSDLLVGVWAADADHVLALGVRDFISGVALRYTDAWRLEATGAPGILSAVWGAIASDLYAVGDFGTLLRFDGTGWRAMPTGTTEFLWAITGAPDARGGAFAVGLNGTVLRGVSGGAASATASTIARARLAGSLAPARGARPARARVLPTSSERHRR